VATPLNLGKVGLGASKKMTLLTLLKAEAIKASAEAKACRVHWHSRALLYLFV